jgi:crotonobetainyl-CoA:carnitine CoA-transferase CaiB-like acyl-CoA transferase
VSGLQYLWNYPEDAERPAGSTNVHPDHLVGRLGAFAVLAGLIGRRRTNSGLHADAAQFETAIGLLGDLFAQESLAPGSVRPLGNRSPRGAPWGCYPCAGDDEWCVINLRTDAEWVALRGVLGDPDWARDPALDAAPGRRAAADAIDRGVAEWTSRHGPREVMDRLQARGVPAGLVAHARHHLEDPHLAARDYPTRVEQPELGSVLIEGSPLKGTAMPAPLAGPAPQLGEHTREIAAEWLEMSEAEIGERIAEGVLEDPPD